MKLKLRDYQKDCVNSVISSLTSNSNIAVVMPTGSGKTAVFGALIKNFLDNNKFGKAIIVSHLSLLVSQNKHRLQEDWGIEAGVLQASIMPSPDDRVVVTTMQSLRDYSKIDKWMNEQRKYGSRSNINDLGVKLIIIDECHLAGCESYELIMGYFKATDAKVIGFTATPFRENKLMTTIFDEVAYSITCQELIDNGYLVPPKLHLTPWDVTDMGDVYSKIIQIHKDNHPNDKGIVYLKRIEDCTDLRNVLEESGVPTSAITSHTAPTVRDEILRDFREDGRIKLLITCDVLTAGFDSPNIKCIYQPYKVSSVTAYLQRIGRGLRTHKGKDHCDIYVGSESPRVGKGFWEKITRQMLGPSKEPETMYEELEYLKGDDKERYKWTKEQIKLAEKCNGYRMENLYAMIITKEMPYELLNILAKDRPVEGITKRFVPPSEAQQDLLNNFDVPHQGLSMGECRYIIGAVLRNEEKKKNGGELLESPDVVKSGQHKGKHYSQTPRSYWLALQRNHPKSIVYQTYLARKRELSNRTSHYN